MYLWMIYSLHPLPVAFVVKIHIEFYIAQCKKYITTQ